MRTSLRAYTLLGRIRGQLDQADASLRAENEQRGVLGLVAAVALVRELRAEIEQQIDALNSLDERREVAWP